jgi:hypothetical protein
MQQQIEEGHSKKTLHQQKGPQQGDKTPTKGPQQGDKTPTKGPQQGDRSVDLKHKSIE